MATLLDRGIAGHVRRMKASAGRQIVYQRTTASVLAAVSLTAWPGKSEFESATDDGVAVMTADRCYLFAAAELFINGANVLPEKGDRIIETVDGQDYTFELMIDKGRPVWEFNDLTRQILRVWVKRVRPL